jgi:hypothetical protein
MIIGKWARALVLSTGLGLGALGLGIYGTGGFGPASLEAKPERERHPHIRAAIRELREGESGIGEGRPRLRRPPERGHQGGGRCHRSA